jgi:Flp pilus assembly protein TadD
MSTASEPTGTLEAALARTDSLLKVDPRLAAEQALEILKAVPGYAPAQLLLAAARRLTGDPAAALGLIEPLLGEQPKWIAAHFEHGLTLAAVGRGDDAIKALQRTVELKPDHVEAWRVLGDHLMAIGDNEAADAAYARHIRCSTREPVLQQAAAAMIKNDLPTAERLLKTHLAKVCLPTYRRSACWPKSRSAWAVKKMPRTCCCAALNWRRASRRRVTTTPSCCIDAMIQPPP